jgi:CRISPR/Cas system-associated protein Cas10 (large subunit of type III CRISPR-Cas system)
VTAVCQETGLPAVNFEDERYLSAEVLAKRKAADKAKRQLTQALLSENSGYAFPSELDKLGRSRGERSYIAVVHADGNSMGERIREIGEERDDRKYIERIRAFSQATKRISLAAMQAVVKLLIEKTVEGTHIEGVGSVADLEFALDDQNKLLLPIRPIIFGGDDTTFVCDGRIGIALAVEYLRAFERESEREGLNLTACAGVAIVKSHYPFARAYALSEELCSEAKKFRRTAEVQGSALDWYFSTSGLYGELEVMRKREYYVQDGSLTLRPVALHDEGSEQSWRAALVGH